MTVRMPGEAVFRDPFCWCGHKKNLHAGADAAGRCLNRSCGCGAYGQRAATATAAPDSFDSPDGRTCSEPVTAPTPEQASEGAFWAWMDAYVDEPHNASYEVPDMQRAYEAGRDDCAAVPHPSLTEWAVFWGGEHPDDCAGLNVYGDEDDADENRQRTIVGGLAKRAVWYGPWTVTQPSRPELAPGEDPDDNLTGAERAEYLAWRAERAQGQGREG